MPVNIATAARTVALQRCDQFVGRTTNWLYDHLCFLPRYTPVVLCDELVNRGEFPRLEAWSLRPQSSTRRVWRRIVGKRLYPSDLRRLKRISPCLLHSHFGYVAVDDLALPRAFEVPWIVSFYGADVYQLGRQQEWQDMYAPVFEQGYRDVLLKPELGEGVGAALNRYLPIADLFRRTGVEVCQSAVVVPRRLSSTHCAEQKAFPEVEVLLHAFDRLLLVREPPVNGAAIDSKVAGALKQPVRPASSGRRLAEVFRDLDRSLKYGRLGRHPLFSHSIVGARSVSGSGPHASDSAACFRATRSRARCHLAGRVGRTSRRRD